MPSPCFPNGWTGRRKSVLQCLSVWDVRLDRRGRLEGLLCSGAAFRRAR